jgi:hypothetical protein
LTDVFGKGKAEYLHNSINNISNHCVNILYL